MSGHPRKHGRILAELLTSPSDLPAALEGTALRSCATCQEIVREQVELARSLEALGRSERDDIRGALQASAPAPGPSEAGLSAHISAARLRRVAATRWRWVALAAAAAVVLVLWTKRPDPSRNDGPSLGTALELLHPRDEVGSFAPFRWRGERPVAGWYRVIVSPIGRDGAPGQAPTDSGPLRAESWNPDPAVMERWGERIQWRLELYLGAGEGDQADSVGAWAWLSSR